jgi:choline dehydrogenase
MKYDYIIIGAGSAGAILATRLTEDPNTSVLLLEAGPDYDHIDKLPDEVKFGYATATDIMTSDHNWQYTARATDQAQPMLVPRGKVTGGSSAINGQIFLRGVPDDYDNWAKWGNDEWSFEKSLPYFRKLETDTTYSDDFHGTDGPIICHRFQEKDWQPVSRAFYKSCLDAGFPDCPDHNAPDSTGVGPLPLNNPNGIRWSTNLGYLSLSRHRLNLTLRANCLVHRILFDGKRATGVVVESGGETFTAEANEIILSAGAVASPQTLMLSGVGPAAHLKQLGIPVVHDLPGVGQNLRDHPLVYVTWATKPEHALRSFDPRIQFGLRFTAAGSDLENDMIVYMNTFATERVDRGGNRMNPIGIRMIVGLDLALGVGEVKLAANDPRAQPILDYNYFQERFDLERMRDAVRTCVKLGEHEAWSKIIERRIGPPDDALASDDALDEWMKREVTTGHHISCTNKMGLASDPMAVVDQYGKVHGLEGLRVVDASIMPDCVRANINVTVMMIGEKIADFVKAGK